MDGTASGENPEPPNRGLPHTTMLLSTVGRQAGRRPGRTRASQARTPSRSGRWSRRTGDCPTPRCSRRQSVGRPDGGKGEVVRPLLAVVAGTLSASAAGAEHALQARSRPERHYETAAAAIDPALSFCHGSRRRSGAGRRTRAVRAVRAAAAGSGATHARPGRTLAAAS